MNNYREVIVQTIKNTKMNIQNPFINKIMTNLRFLAQSIDSIKMKIHNQNNNKIMK